MGNRCQIQQIERKTIRVDYDLLADSGAEIFIINQDAPPLAYDVLCQTLSDDEHERMRQYLSPKLQNRYAVRRGMLRWLIGDAINLAPADIAFQYGEFARPSIADNPIHFNLSHSQQYAMIGICHSEIGVDIEYMRPSDDLADITRTHFSSDEQVAWQALAESEQVQGFYNAWTRKEAFIKMDGRGLQIPLDSFSVSLNPAKEATIISSHIVDAGNWQLWNVPAPNGFTGALVVGTHIKRVTLISYDK